MYRTWAILPTQAKDVPCLWTSHQAHTNVQSLRYRWHRPLDRHHYWSLPDASCNWIYRSRAWCIRRFWSPHCCWCSASFIFLTLHIKRSKTDQAHLPSALRGVRTGRNFGYSWSLCQPTSHPHFFSFLTARPLPTRASSPFKQVAQSKVYVIAFISFSRITRIVWSVTR